MEPIVLTVVVIFAIIVVLILFLNFFPLGL